MLVPARALRRIADPVLARELARAMLAAPGGGGGDGRERESSEDELCRRILAGDLLVVETEDAPRLMDEPRAHELSSLAEPIHEDGVPEPVPMPTTSWIGVEVVDQRGRPLPMFSVHVDGPTGAHHEARLDERGRARLDRLEDDGACTVTLRPVEDER